MAQSDYCQDCAYPFFQPTTRMKPIDAIVEPMGDSWRIRVYVRCPQCHKKLIGYFVEYDDEAFTRDQARRMTADRGKGTQMTDYSTLTDSQLNAEIARRLGWRVENHTLYLPNGETYYVNQMVLDASRDNPQWIEDYLLSTYCYQWASKIDEVLTLDFAPAALMLMKTPPVGSVSPFYIAWVAKLNDSAEYHRAADNHAARAVSICWLKYQDELRGEK